MNEGEIVQIGTPVDLFERPQHTFVGHFIGSPGMNVLPCEVKDGNARVRRACRSKRPMRRGWRGDGKRLRARRAAGIRELRRSAGIPVEVVKVLDAGRYRIVETRCRRTTRSSSWSAKDDADARGTGASPLRSGAYANLRRRLDGDVRQRAMNKTVNQKAWFFVLPVVSLVAFNAIIPLMTVVNYLGPGDVRRQRLLLGGRALVRGGAAFRALPRRACCVSSSSPVIVLVIEIPLGLVIALAMPRKGPWVSVCLVLMALPLLIPWNVVGAMWNIMALPDIGLLGHGLNALGIEYNYTRQPFARVVHHRPDGCLALDVAGRAALLCRPRLDSRCLLSGRQDRRRPAVGGVPLHPAAEAQVRADHRHPAALHGFVHDLHRGAGAHRRRSRQFDHLPVDRPRQDGARPVRSRPGGGDVAHLLPDHPAASAGCSTR